MAKGKTTPTADPFAKMAVVDGGPSKAGTSADTPVTLTIPELADYGPLHKVYKEIEGWRGGEGSTPIKDAFFSHMIPEGVKNGKAPENPKAVDGNNVCLASVSLTRRDNRTMISKDVAARFAALEIRLDRKEHAPCTIRMVPEVWNRPDGAGKKIIAKMIEVAANNKEVAALLAAQGLGDVGDLFQIQTESAYSIVGEHTIDDIFMRARDERKKQTDTGVIHNETPWDDAMIRQLLETAGYVNITPRQVYVELPDAMVLTRKKICPTPEDLEEAEKARKKAASAPRKPSIGGPTDPVADAIAAAGRMLPGNRTRSSIETEPARARRR